ncbi:D-glycerate dehydrogenase [Puniceibacterium sp. IMCC21224]|uniref:2-hydroxyacid dehydrogenase n=1 Tax=Puniceibacterium sp. IMCC21224 TaxID=1618204 RepID=UPI00064DBF18|nr:D-glycerate dehydrogenase [Puniceibacterium sp. IMCC21224]KMK65489.1 lactate dehydrogenase-like oxidoreductase [Puniceibacterium sp. IMCC21224]
MTKKKVLLTRRWPQSVEARLSETYDTTLNTQDIPMSPEAIGIALNEFDAVCPTVSDKLPASIFSGGQRAQILGNYGVGFNHIDIAAATGAGLTVTNTPGVLTDCTADTALTLLLMLARRAGEGERELRAGKWTGWRPTHMMGMRLSGKVLGIIGMGRIGIATARRAQAAFGMKVVYFNRSTPSDSDLSGLDAQRLETVEDVLKAADVVSLHIPGGGANTHMMNSERLALIGPEGLLINSARGDIIDQTALIAALKNGTIGGAGLDVFEGEPDVPAELIAMENTVLLPHLGSATRETREEMGNMVADNLDAFFAGQPVPNPVS